MISETEKRFLRHIFLIESLSRKDFDEVYKELFADRKFEGKWRAVIRAVRLLWEETAIPDEIRNTCPEWMTFVDENIKSIQRIRDTNDPMGYAYEYIIKRDSESPCKFCSGLKENPKRLFKTAQEATQFAQMGSVLYGFKKQVTYKCPDGKGWHLTSRGHFLVLSKSVKRI